MSSGEFVSTRLTPAAQRAKTQAMIAMIEPELKRMFAAFLCKENYVKIYKTFPGPIADCMLGCLPEFVNQQSGEIVFAARNVNQGFRPQVLNALFTTVEVGNKRLRILQEGFAFLYFKDGRRIIISSDSGIKQDGTVRIGIYHETTPEAFLSGWLLYALNNNHLRGQALFADGEILRRKCPYSWDDILLPQKVKASLMTHVQRFLENRERLADLGVQAHRGLIFEGLPGTGKTLAGKCLEAALTAMGITFIWALPKHIKNPGLIDQLYYLARFTAPTVVFLEDIDLFVEDRDTGNSANPVLGQLMTELDGARDEEPLLTIATTNRLDVIEKALRNRPGRFDRIITFEPMHDRKLRKTLLQKKLENAIVSEEDMTYLLETTEEYTPAHISELASTIMILVVQKNTTEVKLQGAKTNESDERIVIPRELIREALEDVSFVFKRQMGFHAA